MKSMFNSRDAEEVIARINALRPDSAANWGKMDVAQMLAHCQQPLRVATGELKLKRGIFGFLFGKMAKKKLFGDQPWDKSLPTDKHFIIADPRDFSTEKEKLIGLVSRFSVAGPAGVPTDPHPFFGKMTAEEWDRLTWNHLNHHLGQFGA